MDTITLSLPQLFATCAVFAVICTVLATAAHRAGYATGFQIGKGETIIGVTDHLTRRIRTLRSQLNLVIKQRAADACRHKRELEAENLAIYRLYQQIAAQQLTELEVKRFRELIKMIDSLPMKDITPGKTNIVACAETLRTTVGRLTQEPDKITRTLLKLSPVPKPEAAA